MLAYGLSWAFWTPYVLSEPALGVWHVRFPEVLGSGQLFGLLPGAFLGPFGSALLVTAVTGGRAGLRAWRRRLTRWRVGVRWYAFAVLVFPATLLLAGLAVPGDSRSSGRRRWRRSCSTCRRWWSRCSRRALRGTGMA